MREPCWFVVAGGRYVRFVGPFATRIEADDYLNANLRALKIAYVAPGHVEKHTSGSTSLLVDMALRLTAGTINNGYISYD